jgi:hypothetical protein
MFDAQKLAKAEVAKLVSTLVCTCMWCAGADRMTPCDLSWRSRPQHSVHHTALAVCRLLWTAARQAHNCPPAPAFFVPAPVSSFSPCQIPTSLPCPSPHQPEQLEREFEELDVDHDGFITAEDLVAASRSAPSANRTNNAAGEAPAASKWESSVLGQWWA